jgi:hypothetical protein
MSAILTQLIEEAEFPGACDKKVGAVLRTTKKVESEAREQANVSIGQRGSRPKPDDLHPN